MGWHRRLAQNWLRGLRQRRLDCYRGLEPHWLRCLVRGEAWVPWLGARRWTSLHTSDSAQGTPVTLGGFAVVPAECPEGAGCLWLRPIGVGPVCVASVGVWRGASCGPRKCMLAKVHGHLLQISVATLHLCSGEEAAGKGKGEPSSWPLYGQMADVALRPENPLLVPPMVLRCRYGAYLATLNRRRVTRVHTAAHATMRRRQITEKRHHAPQQTISDVEQPVDLLSLSG